MTSSQEKIQAARRTYEESFTLSERKQRVTAIEQLIILEEEKYAGCQRHLELARFHLANANGAAPGDLGTVSRSLKRAQDAVDDAKADARRTGGLERMMMYIKRVEDQGLEADQLLQTRGKLLHLPTSAHSHRSSTGTKSQAQSPSLPRPTKSRSEERQVPGSSTSGQEAEAGGVGANPVFEAQLTALIHQKQKEVIERVSDSLCGMQAWLYELKAKRKAKAEAPEGVELEPAQSNAQSTVSTRPASPL